MKRGRPLLLGDELDRRVQAYILDLRSNGAVINSTIVIAVAQGIVSHYDSNMLEQNGGHITLSKTWAKYLLHRMGFTKRRASTKAKLSVSNFLQLQEQFSYDAKVLIEMLEIPASLVINWDQTGIHYVPVSSWTMESAGLKRVEIAGGDDQITAVFAATMDGDFLPPQLIYQGKTPRCLPSIDFPAGWDITFTENHWSNETVMIDYVHKILLPYIEEKKKQLKLEPQQPALVIFDRFREQCTERFLSLLKEKNMYLLIVPPNCTDRMQPLDVSVNKAAKEFMRRQFQEWYAEKVSNQIRQQEGQVDHSSTVPIDFKMAIVKPLGAKWMIKLYDYMKGNPDIITNGFRKAGIIM